SIWSRPTIEAVASTAKAARRKIAGFAAVAVVAAGAVTGGYLQRRPAPILTERDSIVLVDFANTTGETVFDGTLRQALLLKLAESPFLKLLPDDQMTRTLRMMMRPPGEPVTPEVAREVCQRNGLKAVVSGAVSRVGNHYFLQLTATNCSNGESLASSGVEVKNKDTMLRALSNSAVELRSKLGESLQSVRKYDKPFEATSSSLEALRAYTLARKSRQEGNLTDQVAWLERAVALDPKFAYGYAALSAEYWNRRQADKAADYGLKAFELRDQVTERERFNLLDKYYGNVTGQLEEQLQSDKLWTGEYPRDYVAFANLGTAYGIAGQLDKGLEATLEALRLDPGAVTPYGNAMGYYAALGRFDEAKNVYEDARRHNIAYRHIPVFYYDVAFMRHDAAGMAEAVQEAMGKDGAQDEILVEIALADAYAGKLQRAGESLARAVAVAQRKDNKHSMAISYATRAHVEALFGANQEARRDAIKALELAPERDLLAVAGWSLARAGDTARAKAAEQELRSRYRLNTIVNRVYLPALRAEIENANNRPDLAVEALKDTSVYELGTSGGTRALYSLYVRGESYLRTRQGKAAVAEFQKILDRPGVVMNAPLTPLARLGLARGYALDGDTARSRAEYLNFLTIWNEADAGLPIVVRARREYMALQ
ncbi:MAG: serine/threonine protein kinase with repeat, partial [Candidatus Solibacter sp.]|nr:serine/threonine protein kinase with repeat [Candidatus Solibacter sp.]